MLKVLVRFLTSYLAFQCASGATDKVICYYESWASNFPPSAIDVNTCTHVNYAFLDIKNDGSLTGGDDNIIRQLADLKKKKSGLKLLFSVGGWSAGSKTFSSVAANSGKRNKLASDSISFLKKYKFDGIDIDWEYPAQRGGKSDDKKNFISLLEALQKSLKGNGNNYLLSIAVESTPEDGSYDVKRISNTVDFINVMTYDFSLDGKTYENAPLYSWSKDSQWQKENLNCDGSIKNWSKKGAANDKLILGLAFYGSSYKLADANQNGIGAPISGSNGQVAYSEICKLQNGWTRVWNDEQKVPYKYSGTTWIGYDDPDSIVIKVQYAKKNKLGGVMIWAVDQDVRDNSCGTPLPMINAIKKNL